MLGCRGDVIWAILCCKFCAWLQWNPVKLGLSWQCKQGLSDLFLLSWELGILSTCSVFSEKEFTEGWRCDSSRERVCFGGGWCNGCGLGEYT
ncbi:hypothetical protein PVAP13_7KG076027 [Panicum virgatum]|uniref:Uncharacterized protein n=1 Tax=Panicum virgatum TaxID=38727 RepID=A0A8T0QC12_PANVG|nr:hypothetical protein PVAP13_7KG076027 [Panicum virgatum]